jgi:integrase/recombinase XerC/integrase/recombinase XerD
MQKLKEVREIDYPKNQWGRTAKDFSNAWVEGFIRAQRSAKGLDERTVKAYSLDLKLLYLWLSDRRASNFDEKDIEDYLNYLIQEKKLKQSTVTRKYRVFCCYLEYLSERGAGRGYGIPALPDFEYREERAAHVLSKAEIDAFLYALNREYDNLDSDFRKLICLRDTVMMKLLFYHQIEVSELLRLEVSDYNRRTGILTVRKKRGKSDCIFLFSKVLRGQMENLLDDHDYFEQGNAYHNCMFLSKLGKPLSMKMVINIFEKYRVRAGIEKEFTPKDLKNSIRQYGVELVMEQCG